MKDILLQGAHVVLRQDLAEGERYQGVLCTNDILNNTSKIFTIGRKIDDDTFSLSNSLRYDDIVTFFASYDMIESVVPSEAFLYMHVGNLLKTTDRYYVFLENGEVLNVEGEILPLRDICNDIITIYRRGIGPFCRYIRSRRENEFDDMEILWQKTQ